MIARPSPKRNDYGFQQSRLRQALYAAYRRFCKVLDFTVSQSASFTISAVPFSKSDRILPHSPSLSAGYRWTAAAFFILLAMLSLFPRHGMDPPAFQQLQPQFVQCAPLYCRRKPLKCPNTGMMRTSRIVVCAPDKSGGRRTQKVRIYFNFVDDVEIPVPAEPMIAESSLGRRKTA